MRSEYREIGENTVISVLSHPLATTIIRNPKPENRKPMTESRKPVLN